MILELGIEGLSKPLTMLMCQCYRKYVPLGVPVIDEASYIDDIEETEKNVEIEGIDKSIPKPLIKLICTLPSFEELSNEKLAPATADVLKILTTETILSRKLLSSKGLSYLLGWKILLEKLKFGSNLSDNNYLASLSVLTGLISKYKIVYTSLLNKLIDFFPQSDKKIKPKEITNYDIISLSLFSVKDVRYLALHIAYEFMLVFPQLTRKYYSEQSLGIQNKISGVVSNLISRAIWNEEIESLNSGTIGEEVKIHYIKGTREVEATVIKDEYEVKLTIKLPPNYPLREAEIITNKNEIFTEQQTMKWNLAMGKMISQQNSNVATAIKFWKANLDKKLEGVSQCMICYSIVHVEKRTLPTQECKTCKNKFHAACLKKWITTSHKSKCPLCQIIYGN